MSVASRFVAIRFRCRGCRLGYAASPSRTSAICTWAACSGPSTCRASWRQSNKLRSDLVVVTGDTLDHSNEYLPAACEALAALEHRYGRFIIEGNHDLIDSAVIFAST